jgi:hypothetical protein
MSTPWRLVFAEFGHAALGVLQLTFQMIYAEKGYYLEWDEKKAMLLTFGGKGMSTKEVTEIIESAVSNDIFDKSIFEQYGVLTSLEIQHHYFQVVKRRKSTGKQWPYLIKEDENTLGIVVKQEEKEQEKQIALPVNIDAELEDFSPLGENFSILPEASQEKSSIEVTNEAQPTHPEEIFLAYQKYCPDLEHVVSYTPDREEACKMLLEKYNLKQIIVAFKAMNENTWNHGENDAKWFAGFDYCINPIKVENYLSKAAYVKEATKYRKSKMPEHTKEAIAQAKKYVGLVE